MGKQQSSDCRSGPFSCSCNSSARKTHSQNALALRNTLAILTSLDWGELPWMEHASWLRFADHPYGFYLRCDDETRERIWAAIEKRRIRGQVMAA